MQRTQQILGEQYREKVIRCMSGHVCVLEIVVLIMDLATLWQCPFMQQNIGNYYMEIKACGKSLKGPHHKPSLAGNHNWLSVQIKSIGKKSNKKN